MSERQGPTVNEKKLAELAAREREVDAQAVSDLKWLLQQPQFRRWAIGHVYHLCGVNKSIWDPSAKIHLLEGRRTVGIDTLTTFMKFPELYSKFEQDRVEAEIDLLNRMKNRKELGVDDGD